ncbi:MAG: tRNA (adenosine(37)-N6)-dimethylallyltransferase MiaA [Nitrospina sp.]|nr:tRNA (adenosine(37)-N6)-dimethylallyltransferase MiaA [Nitrospina sp.]MBT5651627.1 tRNA (adenosine(37)-N6)-dimethylallyltransferase MiaA [Nitrospina sp.]MBT6739080.1 tRNA (adenosine(37)-N6)-dimethylallyltransferase MiaA [Nitrospina sp.]
MLPLIILTGPTGSGKSETALALARKLDTEIISADSLQVYRFFDIGTAKPSLSVREEIPHHLIDILDPDEEFNAFNFKTRALKIIRELIDRDKIPILVGGTGLYLKVLTEDYDCAEGASPEIREKIRQDICEQGVEKVYLELQRVDPEYAAKISETDSLRIERALGVYLDTGKRFSEFHDVDSPDSGRFPIHTFIIERERSELYSQIDQRVDKMIEQGLANEVKNILDRGYSPELKPCKSIGYAQMVQYHLGNLTLDRATYEIKRETRHFAKRQLTWFRKMKNTQPLSTNLKDTPESLRDKLLSLLPKVTACFLAIFLSFAQTGFADNKDQHFTKAKNLFLKKEWGKAKNSLLALQNQFPDSIEAKRARFLLALIHQEQQKPEETIKLLEPLSKNYGEIGDYIQFHLTQALAQTGKYQKARDNALEFLKLNPRTLLYPQVQLILAEAQIQLGEKETGLKTLEDTILTITKDFGYQKFRDFLPEMIFKLADIQEKSEKLTEAYLNFRQLHIKYPNHERTPEAEISLKRLSALEKVKEVPLTMREHTDRIKGMLGNVRYKEVIQEIGEIQKASNLVPGRFYFFLAQAHRGLRDRKNANEALKLFLKLYPHHAKAQNAKLNIGRNLWNLGQPMAGIKYFKKVTQEAPSSELAVKAQFFLGKIYEERKNFPEALKNYKTALEKYPKEYFAQWAGWRLGWIHYLDGKFEKAFDRFQEAALRFPESSFIEYNLYWSAKSAEKLDKKDVALELYTRVIQLYPYTFHGIRSKERVRALGVDPDTLVQNKKPVSTEKVSAQLNRPLNTKEKFHHVRANELAKIGLMQEARNEIGELQKTIQKNLAGVLWLSHLYHQAQGYAESLRLLHLYKDFTTKPKEKNLSENFWKHFFPLAYEEAVLAYAKSREVDPFFVNGIIRQESLFDSRALSPAGARGLMQIMPATGKKLYPKTKLKKPFDTDALFDPELNIRLGVKYVSQLNKRFGKNGMHILISYNAGPHVLKKWLKRFGHLSDQDVFIESIPYPETRRYVKHVLRNLGIYKALYSPS